MRLPLAQPFKTRTGVPDKDSRMKNCYVEGKGDPTQPTYQTTVRKRPVAQGGVAVGTGTAQGGIGFTINGVPYFIGVWGDTLVNYTGNGTNWVSGDTYPSGTMIIYNFGNYWALNDVTDVIPPPNDPTNWSPVPYYPAPPGPMISRAAGTTGMNPSTWLSPNNYSNYSTLYGSATLYGMSYDGSVMVGASVNFLGYNNAFITGSGGAVSLGTLGGNNSMGFAISYNGTVACGWAEDATGHRRAFRWTSAGGMIDLGTLGVHTDAMAYGMNQDGSIIVGLSYDGNVTPTKSFRWTQATGMVEIPIDFGLHTGQYISGDGLTIVGTSGRNAVMYKNGIVTSLGELPGGSISFGAFATGVNYDGTVICGHDYSLSDYKTPWVWTSAGGMVAIGDLGGNEASAICVSYDGAYVYGWSRLAGIGNPYTGFRYTVATSTLIDMGGPVGKPRFIYGCV